MPMRLCLITLLGISTSWAAAAEPRYELLVAGSGSDNIVAFDLADGADRVVAKLANGSQPRSLAITTAGDVFVGLRGNSRNVVPLVPRRPRRPHGVLVPVTGASQIGRFGPGTIAIDARGRLLVAADTERVVQRFHVETLELLDTITTGRKANVMGLAIHDDVLFVGEYFQKSVVRVNLLADPVETTVLIDRSEHLDRPSGMTIGHNGHLFIANLQNDFVQEFQASNGRFVRTFLDVKSLGTSRVHDLTYERQLERYFLTSGDAVFEVGSDGGLQARYESPALRDAYGMVCRVLAE